jgi:3-deoxy-D-manno-octulosonic-acid transferase
MAERFGAVPDEVATGSVWFHTVSAGETIAAAPLILELRALFPELPFLVTTMTPTGSAQVREKLGDDVAHMYAPYDFPDVVRKFFDRVQPRAIILMETELWPNWIATARARNVPTMLVNARLSEKSARGYARLSALVGEMLQNLTLIACQSRAHRDRFIGLGAQAQSVIVAGSVKYDQQLPTDFEQRVAKLRARAGMSVNDRVWIAASTHPGEDEIVIRAHESLCRRFPNTKLVLVPRHPVRTKAVIELLSKAGFKSVRQSALANESQMAQVLVGDVMGSLQYLYGLAEVAFVGGSFVDVGGHNPIEPALCDLPIVTGPHQFNFTDIMEALSQAGGLTSVTDDQQLAQAVGDWFADPDARLQAGQAAARVVAANRGARDRVRDLVGARITGPVAQ